MQTLCNKVMDPQLTDRTTRLACSPYNYLHATREVPDATLPLQDGRLSLVAEEDGVAGPNRFGSIELCIRQLITE